MKTAKGKALFIEHRNEIGVGAKIFNILSDNDINVIAFSACGRGAQVEFSLLIGERHEEAKQVLSGFGYTVSSEDVLLLNIPDEPGSMAAVLQQLAMADIDLDYAFCSNAQQAHVLVVIKTADVKAAMTELAGLVIHAGA